MDIKFELVQKTDMGEGGLCTLKKLEHSIYIEIKIREDKLNEEVVSHELLHASLIQKGFGQNSANSVEGVPLHQISELLRSVIEHKKIYERQLALGIDTVETQKHKAETIFANVPEEPAVIDYSFIVNALLLLDCLIGAQKFEDLFIERIKSNFNHTYALARRFEKAVFTEDIETPQIFRRAFISGLKAGDEFLRDQMRENIAFYSLQENISISYMPTESELHKKVRDVFYFYETPHSFVVMARADNQACYILSKSNHMENIINITVEDFIRMTDRIITVRK